MAARKDLTYARRVLTTFGESEASASDILWADPTTRIIVYRAGRVSMFESSPHAHITVAPPASDLVCISRGKVRWRVSDLEPSPTDIAVHSADKMVASIQTTTAPATDFYIENDRLTEVRHVKTSGGSCFGSPEALHAPSMVCRLQLTHIDSRAHFSPKALRQQFPASAPIVQTFGRLSPLFDGPELERHVIDFRSSGIHEYRRLNRRFVVIKDDDGVSLYDRKLKQRLFDAVKLERQIHWRALYELQCRKTGQETVQRPILVLSNHEFARLQMASPLELRRDVLQKTLSRDVQMLLPDVGDVSWAFPFLAASLRDVYALAADETPETVDQLTQLLNSAQTLLSSTTLESLRPAFELLLSSDALLSRFSTLSNQGKLELLHMAADAASKVKEPRRSSTRI